MSKLSEHRGIDFLKHVVEYIRLAVFVFLKKVKISFRQTQLEEKRYSLNPRTTLVTSVKFIVDQKK